MEGGPPGFGPGFTCPALLGKSPRGELGFAYGALTRCGRPFHAVPLPSSFVTPPRRAAPGMRLPRPPGGNACRLHAPGFGLARFRSPLLAQSLLFSLPPGTEMFQFPRFAPRSARCRSRLRRVAPFGNPRIRGYLPLRAAYRSLSRPSSPPRAKASFMCPSLLSFYFAF